MHSIIVVVEYTLVSLMHLYVLFPASSVCMCVCVYVRMCRHVGAAWYSAWLWSWAHPGLYVGTCTCIHCIN